MKKFDDVKNDLHHLVGLRLESIRPGAHVTITGIEEESVLLDTTSGYRSRSLNELKRIWNEMCLHPAVHVDEVLHGSGTSRNQPETILANLPYVEWVVINNKKHIAYVGEETHDYGTLKKMDSVKAEKLKIKLTSKQVAQGIISVVVTSDFKRTADAISEIDTGVLKSVSPGIYHYVTENGIYLIVSQEKAGVPVGAYPVINNCKSKTTQRIVALGTLKMMIISIDKGTVFFATTE